ncbi:hypothetical protein WS73_07525 [Burkholderia savannae]|nr:hypothetical protein WS91_23120 [Burkholderia sp. MSMB1498]KWZ48341.1 hypothetical protein WS73_07525 [Burkholderia savannae]
MSPVWAAEDGVDASHARHPAGVALVAFVGERSRGRRIDVDRALPAPHAGAAASSGPASRARRAAADLYINN